VCFARAFRDGTPPGCGFHCDAASAIGPAARLEDNDMGSEPSAILPQLLGRSGRAITAAMLAATDFLRSHDVPSLLARVGDTITSVPPAQHLDKRFIQASYRGDLSSPPDDLLAGRGLFYVTEQRRLFLDCTSGHYQMTWGYHHPQLDALLREARDAGVVWDDHSNIPGAPVKRLSARLVELANAVEGDASHLLGDDRALNTVLLGVCTGSVAASSALKLALRYHQETRPGTDPVWITLKGNYHGTDFLAQRLRGMWTDYLRNVEVVEVEPNDAQALQEAFRAHRGRVAAFLAEPILMNREAILLETDFLRQARALCDEADACLILDEIQTGFWCPEVFMFREYGIVPDMVVCGKGMTAGFHPLSAVLYRHRYDRLEQYDAISTNGGAPLAALIALGCIGLIEQNRERIGDTGAHYAARLHEIRAAYPDRVTGVHGQGLMSGLKFREVADALAFHRRCVDRGLWVRAHAYHAGHSTVLTKLGLLADREVADFVAEKFLSVLAEM
jgi:acetylornithine/succinyldiaminopimelate/putrescine aminotransferase